MVKSNLNIAWTTMDNKKDALKLSKSIIKMKLAACVQLSGPLISIYNWKNIIQEKEEYRLMIKFYYRNKFALEKYVKDNHSYDVPEWIVISDLYSSSKYNAWISEEYKI